MATLQTSDSNFENDVIGSNLPTLVDFWAEWCGPCKQIGPILEEISDEKKDVINIYKICKELNIKCIKQKNIKVANSFLVNDIKPKEIIISGSLYLIGKIRKLYI